MFAIERIGSTKLTPNLLPCTIKHSGPVSADERYWKPSTNEQGDSTAYFRGRKLCGRTIKVPHNYEGVVLQKTDKPVLQKPTLPGASVNEDDDEDDDAMMAGGDETQIETLAVKEKGRFEEVVIWGHETLPGEEDVYVKGVEEWISFATAMHSYDSGEQSADASKS